MHSKVQVFFLDKQNDQHTILNIWHYKCGDNHIPSDLLYILLMIETPKCLLVHCEDGSGPTGMFIALYELIGNIKKRQKVLEIHQVVFNLNKKRKYMVIYLTIFI